MSLSYYAVLLALRIKGIKNVFSKAPIDYMALRKEDVEQVKKRRGYQYETLQIGDNTITKVNTLGSTSKNTILFCPGGAYVSGPAKHHWTAVHQLAKQTDYEVWLLNYTKAPEVSITAMAETLDTAYQKVLEREGKIVLMGDSAGGALLISLCQRLEQNFRLPNLLVALSPVMDASMSNPAIKALEVQDPMLGIAGVRSAKEYCAGSLALTHPLLSPLYGSFLHFPPTILCIADCDITAPDQELFAEKLRQCNRDLRLIRGTRLPHIWPLLPFLSEGKRTFAQLLRAIQEI
ncbi:Esterase/lipase [Tenacibaculum litopenaei]|uniref:alpha/beta hydrolase n=1 Tax=Tenacibaculum litopenaei TaxID=396016 RepID=UPI003892E883